MKEKKKENLLKLSIAIILIILLAANFYTNFLGNGNISFSNFSQGSNDLVINKIFVDKYKLANSMYGLYSITTENEENTTEFNANSKMKSYDPEKDIINVGAYKSQVGLQGHVFSFLYNKLHIPIQGLKIACCIALAVVIICMCYFLSRKYNNLLGVIFYITFLLSPWVVAFARNLYWIEFIWFLPALFGLIISMNYNKKRIFIPCIFLSIFIKCLCGYEYITTIMLMTISFFLIDLFVTKDKSMRKEIIKTIFIVGIVCLLAFFLALCIHAFLRGEGNVIEGLQRIYKEDVLRRTFIQTDAESYTGVIADSINIGIIQVVYRYFSWSTHIILGVEGQYFKLMFTIVLAILIYNKIKKEENANQDIVMFVVFLLTTLSWFILGKAHSYCHSHLNYVLWYFGFIQVCVYIIVNFILKKCHKNDSSK